MHLPSVKTKRYQEQGGQRRYTGHILAVAFQALQSSVLHFRSTCPSLLIFGISSVCRYQMYFNAFPEELSVMRCLFLKMSFSQRSFSFSMLGKGMSLSQVITSWGCQSSAMNRPPPPPAGPPGASLPRPEKAVHWEMHVVLLLPRCRQDSSVWSPGCSTVR